MTDARAALLASLNPLLDHALALEPAERAAWLADLREREPALAGELDALLAAEAELDARRFLADAPALAAPAPAPPALAGRRLGAWTLERPLGQGGMGTVWLARRSDGRYEGTAAVKLLNLALLDEVGAERFRREGNVLARLNHPNIARLLDGGIDDSGGPYLVLEHVEGTRIDRYCDERRLDPRARIRLVRQVVAAVAHAHANLLVHRDLKPSNILVTPDGTVKLLDFGIAKLLQDELATADATTLTDVGGRALTPEYAAPEQVTGGAVTTATDVYALGVLLYVLLAGRHPTAEGSRSTPEHLRAVLETEPPRLGAAVAPDAGATRGIATARLRQLYLGDLENIVAKALKKRPEERYATVTALGEDLRRYLDHEPVRARPDTVGYRFRKFVQRNRAVVAASALAVGALMGTTVFATEQMVEARRQRDEARAQRDRALFEERRALASSVFMETLLQSVAPTGRPYTAVELLSRARTLLEQDYAGDPRFVARMLVELSGHYKAIDQVTGQVDLLTRAAALADSVGDVEAAMQAECGLALRHAEREDSARGLIHLARGRALERTLASPATRARVHCLLAEAQVAIARGHEDSALTLANRAVALAEAGGDTTSVAFTDALATVAMQYHNRNQVRAALEASVRTSEVLARNGRGATLLSLELRMDQAQFLRDLGEMRAADSAIAEVQRRLGALDSGFVHPRFLLTRGDVLMGLGRPAEAARIYEASLGHARASRDEFRQDDALRRLIPALADAGDAAGAERRLAELAALSGERGGWDQLFRARIAEARGDSAFASRAYLAALAEIGFPDGPHAAPWHRIALRAARASLALGDATAADTLARHALRLERTFGQVESRSADAGLAWLIVGRADLARADTAGWRAALARAAPALEHGLGTDHPRAREVRAVLAAGAR